MQAKHESLDNREWCKAAYSAASGLVLAAEIEADLLASGDGRLESLQRTVDMLYWFWHPEQRSALKL